MNIRQEEYLHRVGCTDDRTSRDRNIIINRNCIYTRRSSIFDRKQIFIRWESENWAVFTRLRNSRQRGRCILNWWFIQCFTVVSFRLGWLKRLSTLRWWTTRQRSIFVRLRRIQLFALLRTIKTFICHLKENRHTRIIEMLCVWKIYEYYRESWLQILLLLLIKLKRTSVYKNSSW